MPNGYIGVEIQLNLDSEVDSRQYDFTDVKLGWALKPSSISCNIILFLLIKMMLHDMLIVWMRLITHLNWFFLYENQEVRLMIWCGLSPIKYGRLFKVIMQIFIDFKGKIIIFTIWSNNFQDLMTGAGESDMEPSKPWWKLYVA